MNKNLDKLKQALEDSHTFANGCYFMDWQKVKRMIGKAAKLKLHSSTTNGTSGIIMFYGSRVYFYKTWKPDIWHVEKT